MNFMAVLVNLTVIFLLLIPGIIAYARGHKHVFFIALLGVIPSWGICWVAAFIWSLTPTRNKS